MALEFSLHSERRMIWETEIPHVNFKRTSPFFYFQNVEWCFELLRDPTFAQYNLFISKSISVFDCIIQKKPFTLTSYIEHNGILSFHKQQANIVLFSTIIRQFNEKIGNVDFKSIGKIRIVLIFHGEVGSTLRLQLFLFQNEKFRNVAVGTNDESDAKSPSCSHSSLEILSDDFSKLLDENLYQDVELHCEDDTFKAHKNVLSTRSKVFMAMLQSDMIEGQTAKIEVKDMNSDVCNLLLHYMYTGKLLELTPEKARGLYEAADRYNVGGLMEPCAEFLTMNLAPDNACEMLVLADAHSDPNFKKTVVDYILDQKIPYEDTWEAFCRSHPMVATEVLNKFYKLHGNR